MSALGSAAYGSLPVDADTSVDFAGTSALDVFTEGLFVKVDGPLTLLRVNDLEDKVLAMDLRRGMYAGEVFIFERDFFSDVDVDVARLRAVGPQRYLAMVTEDPTFTLGTQPATAEVVDRVYNSSGSTTLAMSTESSDMDALTVVSPGDTTVTEG